MNNETKITLAHGSGGHATKELIEDVFQDKFSNEILDKMEDSAVLTLSGNTIAYTTDSYVVKPIFFKGGDIGKLAICGTVNDLLMQGATPKYLTVGFILEEGLLIEDLKKIVNSMRDAGVEAGIKIVAGDTKVIEGNGGIYINTSGIGVVETNLSISSMNACDGDVVICSGFLGDHHACILSSRMEIENSIRSDCAPLNEMVKNVLDANIQVHTMRDVTRGGIATVLNEIADSSKVCVNIQENLIPVDEQVKGFCNILGLDPLYMGNEGKCIFIVPKGEAEKTVNIIKNSKYGRNATIIGEIKKTDGLPSVTITTNYGGVRRLDMLYGEGLPRIC